MSDDAFEGSFRVEKSVVVAESGGEAVCPGRAPAASGELAAAPPPHGKTLLFN